MRTSTQLVRTLAVSAVVGVVIALVFEGFESAADELRTLLWVDLIGDDPAWWNVVVLAALGGLAVGVAIRVVPGHGGAHPADGHGLDIEPNLSLAEVGGVLVVGFVVLVAGASLGPEGALLPAIAGLGALSAGWARLPAGWGAVMPAVAVAALLAAMFGSPLAGAVPVLATATVTGPALTAVILPSLTASATAVLALEVLDVEAAGYLQLGYTGFETGDVGWAVLVGAVAGFVVIVFDAVLRVLRSVALRVERIDVVVVTTAGGALLGVVYAIGGPEIRFAGIPELQTLVATAESSSDAALAAILKLVATALCLAIGYRGGRIFPLAFVGGAAGLWLHLVIGAVPADVALGAGLAAAIAVGLESPVVAALIAASLVGPEMLPLAVIAVVVAHTAHVALGPTTEHAAS